MSVRDGGNKIIKNEHTKERKTSCSTSVVTRRREEKEYATRGLWTDLVRTSDEILEDLISIPLIYHGSGSLQDIPDVADESPSIFREVLGINEGMFLEVDEVGVELLVGWEGTSLESFDGLESGERERGGK